MELQLAPSSSLADLDADVLGVLVDDPSSLPDSLVALDAALGGALVREAGRARLKLTAPGSVTIPGGAEGPAKIVLVVPGHVGDAPEENRTDAVRIAGAAIASVARGAKAEHVAVLAPGAASDVQSLVEGVLLGSFRIHRYRSDAAPTAAEGDGDGDGDDATGGVEPARLTVVGGDDDTSGDAARRGHVLASAQNWARDLGNAPANLLTPIDMATEARDLAGQHEHLTFTELDPAGIEAEGMGLLSAVAQGSHDEPRVIILEWNPPGASEADDERLALVGKAVTFDTGGISIKPSGGMEGMKLDKCGGCAVLGAMRAIAELPVPRRVIAVVGATMNMPDGNAYRPGDVVTAKDGTTVEIISTDAEGRLVLGDCISLVRERGCAAIVEASTLTGAMVVALGHRYTGAIARRGALLDAVLASAERTGDLAWHLPMHPEYGRNLKADCADIKNSGSRDGSALSAGEFLQRFAKDTPFVHLDVAGSAMLPKPRTWYGTKGASGWGVRLMADLAGTR